MSQAVATAPDELAAKHSVSERIGQYAHWTLRVALASVFIYHGAQKFAGLEGFAQMMNLSFGVALLVALAEFVGGTLVLAGGFTRDWVTRLGAGFLIPVMVGAITLIHWGQWSFVPSEGYPMGGSEFQATLLLISIYFVLKGNRA